MYQSHVAQDLGVPWLNLGPRETPLPVAFGHAGNIHAAAPTESQHIQHRKSHRSHHRDR